MVTAMTMTMWESSEHYAMERSSYMPHTRTTTCPEPRFSREPEFMHVYLCSNIRRFNAKTASPSSSWGSLSLPRWLRFWGSSNSFWPARFVTDAGVGKSCGATWTFLSFFFFSFCFGALVIVWLDGIGLGLYVTLLHQKVLASCNCQSEILELSSELSLIFSALFPLPWFSMELTSEMTPTVQILFRLYRDWWSLWTTAALWGGISCPFSLALHPLSFLH